ncbi:MAG TPA: hypothetical protein VF921_18510, partial [Vicinamibacterales bacterium]
MSQKPKAESRKPETGSEKPMTYLQRVDEAVSAIKQRAGVGTPDVAIVLGSGLGDFAGQLKDPVSIP